MYKDVIGMLLINFDNCELSSKQYGGKNENI